MQSETGDEQKGCTCSDWVANVPHLRWKHASAPFRFCPWCGQPLNDPTGRRDEALLEAYRQRIVEAFFAQGSWGTFQMPNMLVAAHPVYDYRRETGDLRGTLDLMLCFVETGTRFTNDFGDIDEPFYEGLELMLTEFQQLLLTHADLYHKGDLAHRLTRLAAEAGWLGWGYGDFIKEHVSQIQQHFGDA